MSYPTTTNTASTEDWLKATCGLQISVLEPSMFAGRPVSTSPQEISTSTERMETRIALQSFEEDWNAPGMEVYDRM